MKVIGSLTDLDMLQLADTQVTDAGVAELTGLQQLTYLCLVGTAVTDAAVPSLVKLRGLGRLELVETQVEVHRLSRASSGLILAGWRWG
jgi:hypothetical protein